MILYHRTSAAQEILAGGFIDGEGSYGTKNLYRGVWVSDEPLDWNEGAEGDVLLAIDVPEEAVVDFEWVEDLKPYREFLVPAAVLNAYSPPWIEDG